MHGVLETLGMGTLQLSKNIVVKRRDTPSGVCVCVYVNNWLRLCPLSHTTGNDEARRLQQCELSGFQGMDDKGWLLVLDHSRSYLC